MTRKIKIVEITVRIKSKNRKEIEETFIKWSLICEIFNQLSADKSVVDPKKI